MTNILYLISIIWDYLDQGVFDTYLENEYALMAVALEKAKDSQDNLIYSPTEVYDWLNRIREMGIEQSFKSV